MKDTPTPFAHLKTVHSMYESCDAPSKKRCALCITLNCTRANRQPL